MSPNGSLDASTPAQASTDARLRAWNAARVRDHWPEVHVDVFELSPRRGGWRVRAVVRLATLTPADVRVELVPASAEPGTPTWPLWASQSYDNGCYVFEAPVPPEEPGPPRWRLRVRPAEPLPLAPVLVPVHVGVPAREVPIARSAPEHPMRAPVARDPP